MIHHTFKTQISDNIQVGGKFTQSLTRDGVNALIKRDRDTGLELVQLKAEKEVIDTYLLIGIIIDCVYYSGFNAYTINVDALPDEPKVTPIKKPLPGDNSVFTEEAISGPIHPFLIPRNHHIALHVKRLKPGCLFRAVAGFVSA